LQKNGWNLLHDFIAPGALVMSLLHLSINAAEPQRVAVFLAQLLGGEAMPFPPFPSCWIAFTKVDDGTAIGVYPTTHVLKAGPEQISCEITEPNIAGTFVHVAIASPLDRKNILATAQSEGWLSRICDRGPFECVEVWLEGRLLIEVLDPVMQQEYRDGMSASNWKKIFDLE
jgi:hypothetical protein